MQIAPVSIPNAFDVSSLQQKQNAQAPNDLLALLGSPQAQTPSQPATDAPAPGQATPANQAVLTYASFTATHSDFAAQGNGFQARGYADTQSLSATFQVGGQQFELEAQITRAVVGVAVGAGARLAGQGQDQAGQANGNDPFTQLLNSLPADFRSQIESLLHSDTTGNATTPEATANTLANSLVNSAAPTGGSTAATSNPASIGDFLKQVQSLIDKGFQQALNLLGQAPQQSLDAVQQTRDLLEQQLSQVGGVDQKA